MSITFNQRGIRFSNIEKVNLKSRVFRDYRIILYGFRLRLYILYAVIRLLIVRGDTIIPGLLMKSYTKSKRNSKNDYDDSKA